MGVQVPSPALEKKFAGLAQLVEHLICNQRVACSSHVAGIKRERSSVVEHHLAKVGAAGSNPVSRFDIEKISKKLLTNENSYDTISELLLKKLATTNLDN